eukprot:COSAG01_NODE_34427_length_547_cov_20.285714_1_plen_79_part_01
MPGLTPPGIHVHPCITLEAGTPGPYPQYVDDGQLALGVALLMGSARSFLQRRPWVSTPRREGAADVPAGPDDAPFLLKV